MKMLVFPLGPFATNMYIIYDEATCEAVIVDPGAGAYEKIVESIEKYSLKLKAVWLTHSHWDHIVDIAKVKKAFSLPVYINEADVANLEDPGCDKIPMSVPAFKGASADFFLKDGDILSIAEFEFKVIHTPGHSPGSVCFHCEQEGILISGDTFFKGTIGTLALPTAEPDRMWQSLEKLSTLPPDTKVCPGHGPGTIVSDETWLSNAKQVFNH